MNGEVWKSALLKAAVNAPALAVVCWMLYQQIEANRVSAKNEAETTRAMIERLYSESKAREDRFVATIEKVAVAAERLSRVADEAARLGR